MKQRDTIIPVVWCFYLMLFRRGTFSGFHGNRGEIFFPREALRTRETGEIRLIPDSESEKLTVRD